MPTRIEVKKRKLLSQTILYGAITTALYGIVFANADSIVQLFSRGGYYAALPVATVFIFSFAHGAFASKFWSLLGIEAVAKRPVRRPTVSGPRPAQRPRPRLRLNA